MRQTNNYKFFLGLLLILLGLQIISAEIMITQPNSLYNIGDEFQAEFEVDEFQAGYFDADLFCRGSSVNLFHGVLNAKVLQITRELLPLYISNLSGNCILEARYGIDVRTSQEFKISDRLIVNLELRELNYVAGDNVIIKGKVHKESQNTLIQEPNPSVEIVLGNESKATGIIQDGKFEVNFSTQEDMEAGVHGLEVFVYERDNKGNVLNKGEGHAALTILQEPDSVAIAVDKQTITPGENINLVPFVYDKAGDEILGEDIILKIFDSFDKLVYERLVSSSEEISIEIATDQAAGNSKIILEKEEMNSEKIFNVLEKQAVQVIVENGTMQIINIGNVAYNKPLEVKIGGEPVVKKINLGLGENNTYELSAPTGDYEVVIVSGNEVLHQGSVSLTGNVVSVKEVKEGVVKVAKSPIAWIFIIVILGLTIFVMYKNHKKRKQYAFPIRGIKKPFQKKSHEFEHKIEKTKKAIDEKSLLITDKNLIKPGSIRKAEKVLVLNGQKQTAGIIALKLKEPIKSKICQETLNKAFNEAYADKGVIFRTENTFLIIFSPLVTRTTRNSQKAVNISFKMNKLLNEHNKKFKDKIDFGIGINSGEIINRIDNQVLKFTSVGRTIQLAKKVAEVADTEVLVSQDAHDRTRSNVKVERDTQKSQKSGVNVYRIKKILDSERKTEFVQGFLNRNKINHNKQKPVVNSKPNEERKGN
jgi:hypothetical protein